MQDLEYNCPNGEQKAPWSSILGSGPVHFRQCSTWRTSCKLHLLRFDRVQPIRTDRMRDSGIR